jgi:hypothetical protein
MNVGVLDLTGTPRGRARSRISTFLARKREDAGILIGHGDDTGSRFHGLQAADIAVVPYHAYLWFHSCNCGKILAPEVARKGVATFGFVCNVLLSTKSRAEIDTCRQVFRSSARGTSAHDIMVRVQEEWGKAASGFLLEKRDILSAAVLSYIRLGLRAFEARDG